MGFVQKKMTLICICVRLAVTDEFLSNNIGWDMNDYD